MGRAMMSSHLPTRCTSCAVKTLGKEKDQRQVEKVGPQPIASDEEISRCPGEFRK